MSGVTMILLALQLRRSSDAEKRPVLRAIMGIHAHPKAD
jgi:hypothetical protein